MKILIAATAYSFMDGRTHTYDTQLLPSDSETVGVEYDDTWSVYLEDESFGTVSIEYVDSITCYMVEASFTNTGDTRLHLVAPDGTDYAYNLTVERYSYHVERADPPDDGKT